MLPHWYTPMNEPLEDKHEPGRLPDVVDELCINTIRTLSIDAVQHASSGHPGMPMGAATMAYILWTRHLRHSPRNPAWPDRDRFVLSAGHASMLLYSLLFLTGYDLTMEDLKDRPSLIVARVWQPEQTGHMACARRAARR